MTITINLERDIEGKLETQAAARGLPLKDYVESLVRAAANDELGAPLENEARPTLEEFEADWATFAEGLDQIPPLPPEAFTREAMYRDHD